MAFTVGMRISGRQQQTAKRTMSNSTHSSSTLTSTGKIFFYFWIRRHFWHWKMAEQRRFEFSFTSKIFVMFTCSFQLSANELVESLYPRVYFIYWEILMIVIIILMSLIIEGSSTRAMRARPSGTHSMEWRRWEVTRSCSAGELLHTHPQKKVFRKKCHVTIMKNIHSVIVNRFFQNQCNGSLGVAMVC